MGSVPAGDTPLVTGEGVGTVGTCPKFCFPTTEVLACSSGGGPAGDLQAHSQPGHQALPATGSPVWKEHCRCASQLCPSEGLPGPRWASARSPTPRSPQDARGPGPLKNCTVEAEPGHQSPWRSVSLLDHQPVWTLGRPGHRCQAHGPERARRGTAEGALWPTSVPGQRLSPSHRSVAAMPRGRGWRRRGRSRSSPAGAAALSPSF